MASKGLAAQREEERQAERVRIIRARAGVRQKRERNEKLRPTEVADITTYLQAPVSIGYWRLTFDRRFDGRLLSYLAAKNDIELIELGPKEPVDGIPDIPSDDDDKIAKIRKLGAALRAVVGGLLVKRGADADAYLLHSIEAQDVFDSHEVLEKFPDLVSILEARVYYDDYLPSPFIDSPFRLRRGITFISSWDSKSGSVISVSSSEPLEDLAALLVAAELIASHSIERVFSPEEELFAPYFKVLQNGFTEIIKDPRASEGFTNAFEYFQKNDYTHCISSLGLVAEDYLTQVYEYYLRVPCAKGNALGQIYDQLNSRVSAIVAPAKTVEIDFRSLFNDLKDLKELRQQQIEVYQERQEQLIRALILALQASKGHLESRISELQRVTRRASIFPLSIHENILELIRNRNAASHKNRYPLGNFEALRTLYCLTAFVLWWRATRLNTNWSDDQDAIVRAAVAAN